MCEIVPEKRGVVFRTKGHRPCSVCSASRCRICGIVPSSVRRSDIGLPNLHKEGIVMSIYSHPFSRTYWREAAGELKDLRKVMFAALMIAVCIVLARLPALRLFEGPRITWGFLARALCALVCGPVLGLVFGFAEDLLSFFLSGGDAPFFPGYTLTTMLGVFTYALFFYRSELTIRRIFFAKLLTNIQNVTLGALWMAILSKKAFYVTATASAAKNTIMLPVQTLLLVMLFNALMPVLMRSGLAVWQTKKRIPW